MKAVAVVQKEEAPVAAEVLAGAIVAISEGVKKLRATRLNEGALVLLIQHAAPNIKQGRYSATPVSAKQVRAVLEGMDSLAETYLKPQKKEKAK